ncbi:hypothetical protein [Pseudobutyrivibrio xylanivorans]|uniref:Uncharacterized protein n=1 Tax=Pseudobutyrivibrio xylanivorans TaxID=185007 RepID=A0A5P6VN31_PSEXY|nr:hypothetical protein [Pseudobutyrivibrio xylanivorans]QFJ53830.1 hypothetical protein FXF36_02580 [Pseudobutyrivibrio xylanivorans]
MSKESDEIYEEAKKQKGELLRKAGGLKGWDTLSKDTMVRVVGFASAMDWADGMGDFEEHCTMGESFKVAINRFREVIYKQKCDHDYYISVILGLGCLYGVYPHGISIDDEYKEISGYYDVDFSDIDFMDYKKSDKCSASNLTKDEIHARIHASYEEFKNGNTKLAVEAFGNYRDNERFTKYRSKELIETNTVRITDIALEDMDCYVYHLPIYGQRFAEIDEERYCVIADKILALEVESDIYPILSVEPEHSEGIHCMDVKIRHLGWLSDPYVVCYVVEAGIVTVTNIFEIANSFHEKMQIEV